MRNWGEGGRESSLRGPLPSRRPSESLSLQGSPPGLPSSKFLKKPHFFPHGTPKSSRKPTAVCETARSHRTLQLPGGNPLPPPHGTLISSQNLFSISPKDRDSSLSEPRSPHGPLSFPGGTPPPQEAPAPLLTGALPGLAGAQPHPAVPPQNAGAVRGSAAARGRAPSG
jgi:hypothetical protein